MKVLGYHETNEIEIRVQFHQHSTGNFCTSRFTLNLIVYYSIEPAQRCFSLLVLFISRVVRNFVDEIEEHFWRSTLCTTTFAPCPGGLMKLNPIAQFSLLSLKA